MGFASPDHRVRSTNPGLVRAHELDAVVRSVEGVVAEERAARAS